MIGKKPAEHQMSIFDVALESFIDMNHELVVLSNQIDWSEVESDFSEYYCADNGRPSVPIRTMGGMMLLKSIYNLSDEGVVARWLENPYMQYFTGEKVFQKRPPMNPIDMTKFRKRIGEKGAEKIFRLSLLVNAEEITQKEMKSVMIDSTVQEKNITFPTDAKLYRKIVDRVLKLSSREGIELRRTYTREMKALKLKVRFMNHPTRMKEGRKAVKRMRTIARAMVNDIARKMDAFQLEQYGKDQILRLTGYVPKEALTDRGYRGKKRVGDMAVSIPTSGTPGQSYYQKRKARKKFCKRAGIEPVIGHLKSDHRMMRNYLKGTLGDAINTMMAAAAYNMRHWMNKNASFLFVSWWLMVVKCLESAIFGNENKCACLCANLAIVAE